jgi:hypothetical protein
VGLLGTGRYRNKLHELSQNEEFKFVRKLYKKANDMGPSTSLR